MTERADLVVVGGGIVGLATAHRLLESRPGLRLLVLEKEAALATHQTGRNSGVIHSPNTYAPGSLKARLCAEGKRDALAFADEHAIPYEMCGELIVATDDVELPRLAAIAERARANGVALHELGPEAMREVEPEVQGLRALHVPGTGIIDWGRFALALGGAVAARGGEIRTGVEVTAIRRATIGRAANGPAASRPAPDGPASGDPASGTPTGDGESPGDGASRTGASTGTGAPTGAGAPAGLVLETTAGTFATRDLVTCAGLHADRLAAMTGNAGGIRIVPFRGDYAVLRPEARRLCRTLIYPVPDPRFPFLGVHLARRIDGAVWAGPNAVLAYAREGYRRRDVDLRELAGILGDRGFLRLAGRYWRAGGAEIVRDLSLRLFLRALQRFTPAIVLGDLAWGPSGIRAQALRRNGALVEDFAIARGPHVLHVQNAPSPAATASLAIGRELATMAVDQFGI